jgi:chromosome segregation ATPase
MAEVTNELIYDVLKQVQDRVGSLDRKMDEMRAELQALRTHSMAVQQDINNIYGVLSRHDNRLERIERRLQIAEAPA